MGRSIKNLKTLLMKAENQPVEGWYDPRSHSRTISLGTDVRDISSRLASLHEMYHSYLNGTTGYGTCLVLAGLLAKSKPDVFDNFLTKLLTNAIACHERFATAASVFIATDGSFDRSVLKNYPDYQAYLGDWDELLSAAPHPVLAYMAIENLSRAAMQAEIDQLLTTIPVDEWPDIELSEHTQPDWRIDALLSDGFLKVLFRAEPDDKDGIAELNETISNGTFKSQFKTGKLDDILDKWGHLYFRLAKHRLESNGVNCHAYNGHTTHTQTLIDMVEKYLGPDAVGIFQTPQPDQSEADLLVADFAQESTLTDSESIPAFFLNIREIPEEQYGDLLTETSDGAWLQMVAYPKQRLLDNYQFDPESRKSINDYSDEPIVALRRRIVDPESQELLRVELIAWDSPADLETVAKTWGKLERVVAITSVKAMQSQEFLDTWFPIFKSFGSVPILMDIDPYQRMQKWHELGLKFNVARVSMKRNEEQKGSSLDVFCWQSTSEGLLFFAPGGGTLMGALEYQSRRWPENFLEGTDFLLVDKERLIYTFSHVLKEERYFGFT